MANPPLQASQILEELLASGEGAVSRGTRHRAARKFEDPASPYWTLLSDEREAFHAELKLAEEAGGVQLNWSRFGGDAAALVQVRLVDVDKLAAHLGRATHRSQVVRAREAFSEWSDAVPRLADVLNAWAIGKRVRKRGPESADEFVEAARVIAHMAQENEELPVRVASRQLFRDSKRIDALVPLLDVLTSELWPAPVNHREDVLSGIGLRVAPLPFHMAGVGAVELAVSGTTPVVHEFIAVSPTQVVGYTGRPDWVLCIENLTTFGMASKLLLAERSGLVLYTGGMPSPSWRRAFATVVRDVDPDVPIYHWGDIDEGGFRIAAVVAAAIAPRPLLAWRMDPTHLARMDPSTADIRIRMAYGARRAGWEALASVIENSAPGTIEQEDLPIVLPTCS